jgi:hypothetical protein
MQFHFDLRFRRIGNKVNQAIAAFAPADDTHGPGAHTLLGQAAKLIARR